MSVRPQVPLKPIQTIPPGLLGLLQLKQLGQLPDELSHVVAGVIELRDWYLTARRLDCNQLFPGIPQITAARLLTGNVGILDFRVGGVSASVPPNQIWWVEHMAANVSVTVANETYTLAVGVCNAQENQLWPVGPELADINIARVPRFLAPKSDRGFWAFPGDLFILFVHDVLTAAGNIVSLDLRATPLPL